MVPASFPRHPWPTMGAGALRAALIAGAFLAALPCAAEFSDAVLGTHPIAYYRLGAMMGRSEVGPTQFRVQGGAINQQPGAPIGRPNNRCVRLDGRSGCILTNQAGGIHGAGSLMAWVNLAGLPSMDGHFYYVAGESQNGNDFDLQFETDNVLRFYTASGSNLAFQPAPDSLMNRWHMIVATMDPFTRTRALYWDGLRVAADPNPGLPDKVAVLSMGASTVFGGRFLNGSIGEAALWNRALSPGEVGMLFASSGYLPGGPAFMPQDPADGLDQPAAWDQGGDPNAAATYELPPEAVGVTVASYPDLVPVPGYPVYYAPNMNANYFFYDGMYWVYQGDQWYASSWFNGPWGRIRPEAVPVFILRVPVSYYRHQPAYFGGWRRDAPPRWGEHWGPTWEQRQHGWDTWDHHAEYRPAPLPEYQRGYAGDRYPRGEQQHLLHTQNYHYQPTSPVARAHFEQVQRVQAQPRPGFQAQPQPRPGFQAQPQPRPGFQAQPQPRPGFQAQPQPQPQRQQQPQPQSQPQPQRQQQPQSQPQPQRQQPAPQAAPKPGAPRKDSANEERRKKDEEERRR